MFTLINVAKVRIRPPRPNDYGDQYLYWENELQSLTTPFLDGEAPGSRDLLLFGIVQCHSSIPGPPLVPLQDDERLSALRHGSDTCTNGLADIRTFIRVPISSRGSLRHNRWFRATPGLLRWFARDVYGITTDVTSGALLDAQGA